MSRLQSNSLKLLILWLKNRSIHIVLFFAIPGFLGSVAGSDGSFDLQNYHLFNGWQFSHLHFSDFLPTSTWSFFPSYLDAIYYYFWSNFPTIVATFLFSSMAGFVGYSTFTFIEEFESKLKLNSSVKWIIGFATMSPPLFRALTGSSMQDGTIAGIEIFLLIQIIKFRINSKHIGLFKIGLLAGLIVTAKPAHVILVITFCTPLLVKIKTIKQLRQFSLSIGLGLSFLTPYVLLSWLNTKSLFFPYIQNRRSQTFLTPNLNFHKITTYDSWVIHTPLQFFLHIFFPGGTPALNNEIPFIDITIPVITLFVIIALIARRSQRTSRKPTIQDQLNKEAILLAVIAITTFSIYQLIFTGVRYQVACYGIGIFSLGLAGLTSVSRVKWLSFAFLSLIVAVNTIRPEALQTQSHSLQSIQTVPDYGHIPNSFFHPMSEIYSKPKFIKSGSLIIFGQEETSYFAALWDDTSIQFTALQGYILGKSTLAKIKGIIDEKLSHQNGLYLILLRKNMQVVSTQLLEISSKLLIRDCNSLATPFKNDVILCKIGR